MSMMLILNKTRQQMLQRDDVTEIVGPARSFGPLISVHLISININPRLF